MKCTRCERENLTVTDDMDDLSEIIGGKDSITGGHHNDVGGFAEITGCLHKLKNSEKQVISYIIICNNSNDAHSFRFAAVFLFDALH